MQPRGELSVPSLQPDLSILQPKIQSARYANRAIVQRRHRPPSRRGRLERRNPRSTPSRNPDRIESMSLLASRSSTRACIPAWNYCADRWEFLARQHRVIMPAEASWQRLDAGCGPPVPRSIKHMPRSNRLLALRVASGLGKLGAAFDAAGLEWLALRGPALSQQIYGDPGLRTFRDLDLLVRGDRLEEAVAMAGWFG
jgi:hypothetical protein